MKRAMLTASLEHLHTEVDVCPICLEYFTGPVKLKCDHNLCLECAKLVRQKAGEAVTVNGASFEWTVVCPVCRHETPCIDDSELSGIPRDTVMEAKVERLRRRQEEIRVANGGLLNSDDDLSSIVAAAVDKGKAPAAKAVIPRSIKLMEEYDASIGKNGVTYIPLIHTGYIGYGLDEDHDDNLHLTHWHAMIIGPQDSPVGQVIYNLKVLVPEQYPTEPPLVRFINPKVKMECVDEYGRVTPSKIQKVDINSIAGEGMIEAPLPETYVWDPVNHNIADVLVAVRENMHLKVVCKANSSLCHSRYPNPPPPVVPGEPAAPGGIPPPPPPPPPRN